MHFVFVTFKGTLPPCLVITLVTGILSILIATLGPNFESNFTWILQVLTCKLGPRSGIIMYQEPPPPTPTPTGYVWPDKDSNFAWILGLQSVWKMSVNVWKAFGRYPKCVWKVTRRRLAGIWKVSERFLKGL